MYMIATFFFVVGNWTVVPLGTSEWEVHILIVMSSKPLPHTHPPLSNLAVIHYYMDLPGFPR